MSTIVIYLVWLGVILATVWYFRRRFARITGADIAAQHEDSHEAEAHRDEADNASPYMRIDRPSSLLEQVERLRSLHAGDESIRVNFRIPGPDNPDRFYTVKQLEVGAQLQLERTGQYDNRQRVTVFYKGKVIGSFVMSIGSRLDEVLSSDHVTAIYYGGFEGEADRPCLVVYYCRQWRHVSGLGGDWAISDAFGTVGIPLCNN